MSQTLYTDHEAVSYVCIASIILIYLSTIFTVPQFIKFTHYAVTNISSHDPFFHIRQPTITIVYILLYLIVMYLLYPSILIVLTLINFNIIHTNEMHSVFTFIPLYINDFGNILIFASFFSRAWVLILDRHFSDTLQNWFWRREVNAKESQSNKFIKYGATFRSYRRVIVTSFYIVCIAPLCGIFLFLSYSHYLFLRALSTILLFLLLWFTLHMVRTKVSMITDAYLIRTELLFTIKSAGPFYLSSGVLYLISVYVLGSIEVSIVIEMLCVCMGHLCAVYWSCKWAIRQFEHMHIKLLKTQEQRLRRSFLTTFSKMHHVPFEKIMSHRAGVEAFAKHLADEFGLESMLFIIEVSQYKAVIHKRYADDHDGNDIINNIQLDKVLPTAATALFAMDKILEVVWMPSDPRMRTYSPYRIALYLYDKYIESSADLCVNISSVNRRAIYKSFKELALRMPHHDTDEAIAYDPLVVNILYTLFDEALIEIWHLVQMDTFTRFKSTQIFERLLHEIYPKETKQALDECHNAKTELHASKRNSIRTETTITSKPEIAHMQIAIHSISPDIPEFDLEDSESTEEKHNTMDPNQQRMVHELPMIAMAMREPKTRSHSVIAPMGKNTLTRPQLDFRSKSSRREDVPNEFESIVQHVMVPASIITTAADFWRINVNALPQEEKLEMGVAIYLSMLASDRTLHHMFKKTQKIRQEQIELLSLKFLDMICWLIQMIWNRHNQDLNCTLSRLGAVHKKLSIQIKHFNVMLPVLHETLSFYFPVRYRLQEQYAIDYIFAYSAEIMMGEPLSTKTRRRTYYKALEFKFNSEKKKNDLLKNRNTTGLKMYHEISAPVMDNSKTAEYHKLRIQSKYHSTTSFHLPNTREIIAKLSPQPGHRAKLKDDRSNSLSMGLIHTMNIA